MIKITSAIRKMILYKIGFIIAILLLFVVFNYYTYGLSKNFISLGNLYGKGGAFKILNSGLVDFENIAIIIESRSTPLLVTIVSNIIQNIPSHWPIQIFHSQSNNHFIRKSRLSTYIQTKKIILTELEDSKTNFTVFTNTLLTNISFWKQVRGEKVFLFQIDSIMCSNSPHKITDYLQYDYIGAPWSSREPRVGNGGFSLRSKNKTITLLNKMSFSGIDNEDVWYSIHMSSVGSIAPVNVSKTFSVESIFYDNPLGVHKMGINKMELKKLCETCPEARLIPPYCM